MISGQTQDPDIFYEDNHLIAVRKPANILVQGDASGDRSLMDIVKDFIKKRDNKPGNVFLGLIHRLDRPVEGVVIFGKTSKGASRLSEQIREKKVKKTYKAAIEGKMDPENGEIRSFIEKDDESRVSSSGTEGKEAYLKYRKIGSWTGGDILEIDLGTGRFHQIRAQLSDKGHPIAGDIKYGSDISLKSGKIALSCMEMQFFAPITGEPVTVSLKRAEWEDELTYK